VSGSFNIKRDELNSVIADAERSGKLVELKHEFDPNVVCLDLSVREEGHWMVSAYIEDQGGYVGCLMQVGPESFQWARVSETTTQRTIANRLTKAEESQKLVKLLFGQDKIQRLVKHYFYTTEENFERVMYCYWVNETSLECDSVRSRIPLDRLIDVTNTEIHCNELTECPGFREKYKNLVLAEFAGKS